MDPLAYLSKIDKYTMYFHQATWQPEKEATIREHVKEIKSHCDPPPPPGR